MPQSINGARAAVEQRAGDTCLAQDFRGALNGIALADRTEIEHDSFARELDREVFRIKMDQVHPDHGACLGQFFGGRQTPAASHKAPTTNQGTDSNIKSAAGFLSELLRVLQEGKKRRCHAHGGAGGAGIQDRDFARRSIEAELFFEPFDLRDCFFARSAQCHSILSMQDHLEPSGHRRTGQANGWLDCWIDGFMDGWWDRWMTVNGLERAAPIQKSNNPSILLFRTAAAFRR